jgi:N6-L-threonylcarbamoyladenine synthase
MPCFLAGVAAAEALAAGLDVPLYTCSHQAGHLMAALYSADAMHLLNGPFGAFHVSGGTTDILLVKPHSEGFSIEQIGGSEDINAGQAIDRTGVLMGLSFPCGREMERICLECGDISRAKTAISVKGMGCNLSGLENLCAKMYAATQDKAIVSAYCFDFIADTLYKLTDNLREEYPDIPVIYAGGVMSNGRISRRLGAREGVYFAKPEFSADNAAGIALLCRREYIKNQK